LLPVVSRMPETAFWVGVSGGCAWVGTRRALGEAEVCLTSVAVAVMVFPFEGNEFRRAE
jgi:hypothetical protein